MASARPASLSARDSACRANALTIESGFEMLTPDGAGKSTLIRLLTRDVRRLIHELELGITPARIRSTLRQVIPKMRPRRS